VRRFRANAQMSSLNGRPWMQSSFSRPRSPETPQGTAAFAAQRGEIAAESERKRLRISRSLPSLPRLERRQPFAADRSSRVAARRGAGREIATTDGRGESGFRGGMPSRPRRPGRLRQPGDSGSSAACRQGRADRVELFAAAQVRTSNFRPLSSGRSVTSRRDTGG